MSIEGTDILQVPNFLYLGQQITEDGRREEEIKRRTLLQNNLFKDE